MEKGKNFSCNNTGNRKKSDFYETPYSITKQLLDVLEIDKNLTILEPSAGDGAIVKVLNSQEFNNVTARDISTGHDFLNHDNEEKFDIILTNPPFSLAMEFIKKAKEICNDKIIMLLPLSYLHGEARYKEIYMDKDFRLKEIYVFTRYPMLGDALREDGKYRTGMMVYAWFVFEKSYKNEPVIKWISNQEYIISKKDEKTC